MNSEVTREIDWLRSTFSVLDTKVLAFLGFASLAVPYIMLHRRPGPYWIAPVALVGLGAVSAISTLRVRNLESAPNPTTLCTMYEAAIAVGTPNTKETLLAEVVRTKADCYDVDATARKEKRNHSAGVRPHHAG